MSSGVSAMVHAACWFTDRLDIEVLSIGRSAHAVENCLLEIVGKWLAYRITLRGGWVWLYACSMNESEPQLIFNVGDTPSGWTTVRKFAQALERSGVKSLRERPVEIGEPGSPDSWVIA